MEIDFSPNIRPLFPFNVIFDTDFGLIRLIRDEYADDKVFDLDVLNLPDDELKEVLVKRTHVNPFIVCMKKFDNETALEYYNQFFEREYTTILENSIITGIGTLFSSLPVIKDIVPTVHAQQQIELDFLKAALKNPFKYNEVLGPCSKIDCSNYDPIIIKNGTELLGYRNYDGHMIYIPRYGFNTRMDNNMREMVEPAKAYMLVMKHCNAQIIDVYERHTNKERNYENE